MEKHGITTDISFMSLFRANAMVCRKFAAAVHWWQCLSVLSVLRCCDFSMRRCRCRWKEIKMYVIAVAWFFQINFSKNETPVSYEPRQTRSFAISFHRKRYLITVKRCWFSCMLCSKSGPSHVISLGLKVKFYKLSILAYIFINERIDFIYYYKTTTQFVLIEFIFRCSIWNISINL